MSFRLAVSPHRRAAARLIDRVHRRLMEAYAGAPEVTQAEIARTIGVHRSVINRQLRGHEDISIGRVAEIAHVLGLEADFDLYREDSDVGQNVPHQFIQNPFKSFVVESTSTSKSEINPSTNRVEISNVAV